MKRLLAILILIGVVMLLNASAAQAEEPLRVVATLSTFADLAKTVGGDHVAVSFIASPKFDPHFIEPKPSDVLKVKKAELFVHAGLDLEAWRGPLLDAAGNRRVMPGGDRELDLSLGIALLEVPDRAISRAEGDIHLYGNPHYWTDPQNGRIMAQAICDKLCAIDPSHEQEYHRNLAVLLGRLDQKMPEWQRQLASFQGQELIGYHSAWPYLMQFAGLRMEQFLEPKPGIPPTPRQLEFLERYVSEHGVRAIVQSMYFPARAAESLAQRTGARVVLLCQNVGEVSEASDYIATVEYNVTQLERALAP